MMAPLETSPSPHFAPSRTSISSIRMKFDKYFLESSLSQNGRVEQTVEALNAAGMTYESDGALWLRTSKFGDDKDRVMRRDGTFTYFLPDVAYHVNQVGARLSSRNRCAGGGSPQHDDPCPRRPPGSEHGESPRDIRSTCFTRWSP